MLQKLNNSVDRVIIDIGEFNELDKIFKYF